MSRFFSRKRNADDDCASTEITTRSTTTSTANGSLHYSCATALPNDHRCHSGASYASVDTVSACSHHLPGTFALKGDMGSGRRSAGSGSYRSSCNSNRKGRSNRGTGAGDLLGVDSSSPVSSPVSSSNTPTCMPFPRLSSRSRSRSKSTIRGVAACGRWKDDAEVSACELCRLPFSMADATSTAALKKLSPAQRLKLRLGALLRRKHHCRQCGGIFCDKCSGEYIPIPTFGYTTDAEQRVCLPCFGSLCNQLTHGSTAAQNARLNQKLNIMYLPSSGRGSGAPTGGRYSNVQGHQLPSGVISRTGSVDSGFYAHTLNGTGRESVTSTIGGLHGETESRFNFPPRYSSSHIFYHQQSTTSSMAGPHASYYPQGSVIVHHGDLATVENSFASHLHPTPNNAHRSMALPPAERPPSTQPTENEEDGYYTSGLTPRGHAQHRRSCGDYLPPRPTFLAAPNNKACDAADDLHNAYSAQDPGAQSRSILQAAIQNSQRVEGSNGDNYVPFATYPYQQQQQFVDDSFYGEEEDDEDFNEEGEEEQDEGSYYGDGEEDEEYYDDEEDYDDDDYTTSSTSGSDLMAPPIPTHELLMAAQPPLNGGGNLSGGVSQNTSFALTGRVTDGDIDFEDDGDLEGGSSGASASRHLKNHSSGNFYAQLSPASTGVAGVIHNHRQQHHHHSRSASMNSPGKPRGVSVMGINGNVVTAGAYRLPGSAEPFNDTTTSTPSAARTHHQEGSKSLVLTGDYVRALQTGAIRSTSSSQPRRGSRRRHPSLSPVIRCATPQHRQGSSTSATPMQSTSRNGSIQLHGAIVAAQQAQTESSSSSSCGSLGTPKMALEGFEPAFEPNNDHAHEPSQMNNVQAAEMQDSFSDSESDDDEGALCTPVYLKQIALQQTLLSQQPSDVLPPIKAPLPSFKQQHIDGHHIVKSPFTTNQVDDSLATHNLHTSIPMSLRTVSATTADTTASIITQINIPKNDDGGAFIGYTCNVITVLLYPASGREQALVCTVSPMETLFDLAQRIVENYLKLIFNPFKPRPSEEMLNQTIRRHLRFLLTPALHAVPIDSDKAKKLRVFDVIALHDRVVLTAAPVAIEEPPTASGIGQSNAPLLAAEVDALREFLDGAVSHPPPLVNNSEPSMVPSPSGRRSRTNSRRAASFMVGSECSFTTTQQGGFYDGTSSV